MWYMFAASRAKCSLLVHGYQYGFITVAICSVVQFLFISWLCSLPLHSQWCLSVYFWLSLVRWWDYAFLAFVFHAACPLLVTPLCLEILCSVPCVCTSCFFVACSSTLWARSPCSFAPRSALQPPGGNQVDGLPPARHNNAHIVMGRPAGAAKIGTFCHW